jgi:hypothetical protein
LKKAIDICQENVDALHLSEIQKITSHKNKVVSGGAVNHSKQDIMNQSVLSTQVFEDQFKRQYKYADIQDASHCEREIQRMLEIIKHLFYASKISLEDLLFRQQDEDQAAGKSASLSIL